MESRCGEATFSTINRQPQVRKSTYTRARATPSQGKRVAFVSHTRAAKRCSMSCMRGAGDGGSGSYSASRSSGAKYRWRHRVLFAGILVAAHNFPCLLRTVSFPSTGCDCPSFQTLRNFHAISRTFPPPYISRDSWLGRRGFLCWQIAHVKIKNRQKIWDKKKTKNSNNKKKIITRLISSFFYCEFVESLWIGVWNCYLIPVGNMSWLKAFEVNFLRDFVFSPGGLSCFLFIKF